MNKQVWLDHFMQVVNVLLQNPGDNQPHFWTAAALGFLVMAWVFCRTAERMDVSNAEGFSGFVTAAVGVAALLAIMTAASIYVAPALKMEPSLVFLVVVAVVASVAIVVPIVKFWTQSGYTGVLMTWFISLAAGAAIIVAVGVGFGAYSGGKKEFDRGKSHNRAVQEVINMK